MCVDFDTTILLSFEEMTCTLQSYYTQSSNAFKVLYIIVLISCQRQQGKGKEGLGERATPTAHTKLEVTPCE